MTQPHGPDTNELFKSVGLLSFATGVRRSRITPGSRLAEDFGMSGDDAIDCFRAYAAEFNLSLAGFEFDAFFLDEVGGDIFKRRRPITVSHLVDCAFDGKWKSPAL